MKDRKEEKSRKNYRAQAGNNEEDTESNERKKDVEEMR